MDILRKELNAIYQKQNLDDESLPACRLENCRQAVQTCVAVDGDCRVITDASADVCWVFGGAFAHLLGLDVGHAQCGTRFDSSDEDEIYVRIHPEDLAEKRMLEYEFFKFVDALAAERKMAFKATCRLRMKCRDGNYIAVDNSTQIMQLSPAGKMWLILCCYRLSSEGGGCSGISPRIINCTTGETTELQLAVRRAGILTIREKEILRLIQSGCSSKQIAAILGISINTVNRHRQNILEKLSVGNSVEAVAAANAMRLF